MTAEGPDPNSGRRTARRNVRKGTIVLFVAAPFIAGILVRGCIRPAPSHPPATSDIGVHRHAQGAEAEAHRTWTCSMHPQIRQPKPGKCPICGMDLIPVPSEGAEAGTGRRLTVSPAARALMRVQTSPVERRYVTTEIRMVGKVAYDETRLAYIAAWVSGRLERLYVDYTGIKVNKGDHLADIYSPELLLAQEELRRTARAVREMRPDAPEVLKQTALTTLEAARSKLRRFGLTEKQIKDAETPGTPLSDRVTVYAPIGGTVIERNGQEGMYVETGARIYTLVDLSQVWVKLDAYESDLMWLRYGQKVTFETEAYPGEAIQGTIAFIDPVLNPGTRTVKVRVNVPNPDGKLKPEMFVRAVVRTQVASAGQVMEPHLAGKWMCPMHPEIVKERSGSCDRCGMPLVRTESLGYAPVAADDSLKPLVIPASAPLITGKRAVAYVEVTETDRPTFEGRDVILGPRAGDYYLVVSGLREGEQVVTQGNFKIDSSLQIQAKPSMMSPEEEVERAEQAATALAAEPDVAPAPESFQGQLRKVLEAYLRIQDALAADDFDKALETGPVMRDALHAVDMTLLTDRAHDTWMTLAATLQTALDNAAKAKDIETFRVTFSALSERLTEAAKTFGTGHKPVYVIRCPMAFDDRGAIWLQGDTAVRNPYFGASMLTCGNVIATLGKDDQAHGNRSAHE